MAQVLLLAVAIVLTSGLGIVNPLLIRAVFDRALFCGSHPVMILERTG